MSAHRLTLVPWAEPLLRRVTRQGVTAPVESVEPRWTAACDCGWHSTTSEPTPDDVLMGYSEHLPVDEMPTCPECARRRIRMFVDEHDGVVDVGIVRDVVLDRVEIDRAELLRRIEAVAWRIRDGAELDDVRELLDSHRDLWEQTK